MRVPYLALLALPLCAQTVSIGGKIGIPFVDPMGGWGESRPYAVGPTVEFRLPAGFAVEGSALYRRLGSTSAYNYGPDFSSLIVNRARGNAWEFPVIGKYYFNRDARWQPYLGTGWSLQTVGWHHEGSTTTTNTSGSPVVVPFQGNTRSDLNVGATVVTGLRFRVGRISLLPEVRYTRWGSQTSGFAPNRKNDGGVYLGIRF